MKPTLLISKLDNIKIIQVGESILTTKNSKQESTKVGFDKVAKAIKNKGTTKTVDLGKGAEKHRLKFYVFDREQNDAIFSILRTKRYVAIIDKFKGKIEVYIDDYKIIDSDKHINRTVYELNCTVQDLEKAPTVNFTAKLKNTVIQMEKDIADEITRIAKEEISTVDTITDTVSGATAGVENFVDSTLNSTQDGIGSILELQSKVLDAYKQVKSRVDKFQRLATTLKNLVKFPLDFINLVMNTMEEEYEQSVGIFEIMVGDKKFSDIKQSEISQVQYKELKKIDTANKLNNMIVATMGIKQALKVDFASQVEFETHIKSIILRLENTSYTYEEIVIKQQTLKAYANTQKYREIIEIEIKTATPLTAIVYDLYGNLDNYADILKLNNLKDNDIIAGTLKVYENASNN